MSSGIYVIENIKNNKKYIAAAKDIERRIASQKKILKANKHPSNSLQNDFNEEPNNFIFKPLVFCEFNNSLIKEQELLSTNEYVYNEPLRILIDNLC